jgi:chromosome segregation ATPase
VSALYRQGLGQSAVGDAQHPHHWRVWHRRLLLQRVQALGFEALADTLVWHAVELDRVQSDHARQAAEHHAAVVQLQQVQAALVEVREHAAQSEAARLAVQHQLEAFGRETQAALAAKESALQLIAAQAAQQAAQRELQAQTFAAQAGAELDALQARLQALASEHLLQLQSKEAELQRQAAEAASTLTARQAAFQQEAERLAQRVADLQSQVAQGQAELRSVYASRSWRWTAWLRRGARPVALP